MAFEMKTTLAFISFVVIALLVYPMISATQWDKLDFNFSQPTAQPAPSAPPDWRALISE